MRRPNVAGEDKVAANRGDKFNDRKEAAEQARKALLEKFRSRPAPDDPAMLAAQAQRKAIAEARAVRQAEREVIKAAEARRLAEEEEARQAELARLAAEEAARVTAEKAAQRALLAEQKAARDARYAARKARR